MKTLLRILGVWLLLAAMIAVAIDATKSLASPGEIVMTPLGEYWYKIDAASLNGLQAGIERYLLPFLWDPVIITILQTPAWALLGGLGIVFYWFGRLRRRVEVFAN